MKKRILTGLILSAGSLICADAMAIAPGLYMGLMMGPATNSGGEKAVQVYPLPTATSPTANTGFANPKSTQFGSRLFLGYKFNPYASFEGGFTYFSGINYILKDPALVPTGGTTGRVRLIDFVGKLDYSYNNTVGFYGKVGVAATYTTTPGALNITNYEVQPAGTKADPTAVKIVTSGSNTYTAKLSPTFALGVSYDIDQSWQIDASWNSVFVGGSIGSMTLYGLALSYHFVDVYCGQFLCAE